MKKKAQERGFSSTIFGTREKTDARFENEDDFHVKTMVGGEKEDSIGGVAVGFICPAGKQRDKKKEKKKRKFHQTLIGYAVRRANAIIQKKLYSIPHILLIL